MNGILKAWSGSSDPQSNLQAAVWDSFYKQRLIGIGFLEVPRLAGKGCAQQGTLRVESTSRFLIQSMTSPYLLGNPSLHYPHANEMEGSHWGPATSCSTTFLTIPFETISKRQGQEWPDMLLSPISTTGRGRSGAPPHSQLPFSSLGTDSWRTQERVPMEFTRDP